MKNSLIILIKFFILDPNNHLKKIKKNNIILKIQKIFFINLKI
jgi:hypothetical protein